MFVHSSTEAFAACWCGALRDRKVLLARRDGGQGIDAITLGTTAGPAPVPQRYSRSPMGSSETLRVQVFNGEARVLDYRFGF